MPLIETNLAGLKSELEKAPSTVFVILTSTADGGEHWCPPCALMQPIVDVVFGASEAVGIVVRLQQNEVISDANWTLDAWGGGGVPMIHRIVNGTPQGELLAFRKEGFRTDLERYIESEEAYEAWLKERRGESYEPPEVRIPATRARLDNLVAMNRALEAKYKDLGKAVGTLD